MPIRSQVQPTGGMHSLSASEPGAIPLRDGDFAGNGGATENREAYPAPRRLCEIGIGAEGPDLGGFEYLAAMGYLKVTRVAGAGYASSSSLMTLDPAHVHVLGEGAAKISLGPDGAPELVWADNMSRGGVRPSMRLVAGELHARTD